MLLKAKKKYMADLRFLPGQFRFSITNLQCLSNTYKLQHVIYT